jgi:DNA invertase Pin-like site-specific DNA recombinase
VEKQNIISLVQQGVSYREIERRKWCGQSTAKEFLNGGLRQGVYDERKVLDDHEKLL